MLDPYYTGLDPHSTGHKDLDARVGENWPDMVQAVLKRFYRDSPDKDKLVQTGFKEFQNLLCLQGRWAERAVKNRQEEIATLLKESKREFKYEVEKTIFCQQNMTETRSSWILFGDKFPVLQPLAKRLALVSVNSANVERVCKSHGIVHTKVRNRLKHTMVQMLLFCYVNLRLLNQRDKNLERTIGMLESETERLDKEGDDGEDDGELSCEPPVLNETPRVCLGAGRGLCVIWNCGHQEAEHNHKCNKCNNYVHNLCAQKANLAASDGSLKWWCSQACLKAS